MNPSPFERSSVWTMLIGFGAYFCTAQATSQNCVQKLFALKDMQAARKYAPYFLSLQKCIRSPLTFYLWTIFRTICICAAGLIAFNLLAVGIGLVIYAELYKCDPFTAGLVRKRDQVSRCHLQIDRMNFIVSILRLEDREARGRS